MSGDLFRVHKQVEQLYRDIAEMATDSEQEIDAWIVPMIAAVIDKARQHLPEDAPVRGALDFLTPEMIQNSEEPIRAIAVKVVVGQVMQQLPPYEIKVDKSHLPPSLR